ncbi:putative 46 kDa FK506-binding nuclear protein [Neospora caninum Liverpool]|uniref:46 kDa FK506-binding nuclear protein, putative n=2 Tax=Sarcocystidae TaxID=5809 RepID=F0VGM7_NEOCL|nr:putative 46 kDa FK506-binding nuclear protein [Neospora caninum Liverpool]CBZ52871.1 putative 46 kDa FK506-binding nuclear protein [Neospora caninum Liverpool]CEL66853.1 TPA: 46 kDa FK506-binding nuclear protein, putative [Neospora caninum Liverpool]|eukprot:XP_003882903.1 putative 46 kDa FK506-binding nuclear protein [Neospora caninum Liverpool]
MFYGVVVKPGQTVTLSPEDGGEVLHLSQVCMPQPKDAGRTYVQVTQEGKTYSVCMLQKDKLEFTNLDLFLSTRQGISIKTEGGKNEVHLTGYFEPDAEGFDSDEDEEDSESDMEENVVHHAKKHIPTKGGKIEDLDGNDDEEDDEDEEDDDEEDDDDDDAEMKALTGGDDDDEDEDDEDENEGSEDDEDADDMENGIGEDSEEDDEEDEEEDESPQNKKASMGDKKRKALEAAQTSNKKAKPSAAPAKGQAPQKGDAAAYKSALVDFLKKNGKTPLATLGQKVKKPAGVSEKMAQFLKANASTFDVSNGVCSLK